MIISFMSRDDGVSSKDLSNDKIGRDPLRQFPVKFNSSLTINFPTPCPENTLYALSSVHRPIQKRVQFCKCNFIEGPLGAFDNHRYKSCPCFLDTIPRNAMPPIKLLRYAILTPDIHRPRAFK